MVGNEESGFTAGDVGLGTRLPCLPWHCAPGRPFGADRLEAAATRAIEIGMLTYGSMRPILDNKLDRQRR